VKEFNITVLDGSTEEQNQVMENYLNSITEEEHNKAMSDEFGYLDEE